MSAYEDAMLNAEYVVHGVDAVVTLSDSTVVTDGLRVIDDTVGAQVGGFSLAVQSIEPMCSVRMTELAEKNVTPKQLIGCMITFSGNTWRSRGNRPKPVLGGLDAGELLLLLAADLS